MRAHGYLHDGLAQAALQQRDQQLPALLAIPFSIANSLEGPEGRHIHYLHS